MWKKRRGGNVVSSLPGSSAGAPASLAWCLVPPLQMILTTSLCCVCTCSDVDMLLKCLGLMITDRQQSMINKQVLFNRIQLEPPQAAAAAELAEQPLQQQQQQGRMGSSASSPLLDSLDSAAGAQPAALGLTAMTSARSNLLNAVQAAAWDGTSRFAPQSSVPGRDGSAASGGSSSSGTKHAAPPAGSVGAAQTTAHGVGLARQGSPLRSQQRPSDLDNTGVNKTSFTVVADLTSLDHPQQQQQQQPKQQQQKQQQQRLPSQPLQQWELEGSQFIESW